MKAQIGSQVENAQNLSGDKEMVDTLNAVVAKDRKLVEPIIVRWYMGRSASSSVVYCSIWLHGNGIHNSGHGKAGGGGYHKKSEAFAQAVKSANIKLSECVGGRGDGAVRDACKAILKAMGYRSKPLIVEN